MSAIIERGRRLVESGRRIASESGKIVGDEVLNYLDAVSDYCKTMREFLFEMRKDTWALFATALSMTAGSIYTLASKECKDVSTIGKCDVTRMASDMKLTSLQYDLASDKGECASLAYTKEPYTLDAALTDLCSCLDKLVDKMAMYPRFLERKLRELKGV
jgi:hypothetical protein